MVRIVIENAAEGTALEIGRLDGHMRRLVGTVTSLSFTNPKREKAHA